MYYMLLMQACFQHQILFSIPMFSSPKLWISDTDTGLPRHCYTEILADTFCIAILRESTSRGGSLLKEHPLIS